MQSNKFFSGHTTFKRYFFNFVVLLMRSFMQNKTVCIPEFVDIPTDGDVDSDRAFK